jgi:hypothetical protein
LIEDFLRGRLIEAPSFHFSYIFAGLAGLSVGGRIVWYTLFDGQIASQKAAGAAWQSHLSPSVLVGAALAAETVLGGG